MGRGDKGVGAYCLPLKGYPICQGACDWFAPFARTRQPGTARLTQKRDLLEHKLLPFHWFVDVVTWRAQSQEVIFPSSQGFRAFQIFRDRPGSMPSERPSSRTNRNKPNTTIASSPKSSASLSSLSLVEPPTVPAIPEIPAFFTPRQQLKQNKRECAFSRRLFPPKSLTQSRQRRTSRPGRPPQLDPCSDSPVLAAPR